MSNKHLLLVVAFLFSLISVGNCGGFWSNGNYYTDVDVLRFTPILMLHPEDVFMPINLRDLVGNSTMCQAGQTAGTCTTRLTLEQLGEEPYVSAPSETYFLYQDWRWTFGNLENPWGPNTLVNCATRNDGPYIRRRAGSVTSNSLQLLWSVQNITDSSKNNIVLNFFVIQGFAGPQTISVAISGESIVTENTLADHAADLQWISVVVDKDMQQVQAVGTTGHGCTRYHPTALVGNRPIVYSALNTHSVLGSASLTGVGDLQRDSHDNSTNAYFSFFPWATHPYLEYRNTIDDPNSGSCPNSGDTITGPNPWAGILVDGHACVDLSTHEFADIVNCPYKCDTASPPTCVQTGNEKMFLFTPHVRTDDLIGAGGPVWAPELGSLYQVGLNSQGQPVQPNDNWVRYTNRYGYSSDLGNRGGNACDGLVCRYGVPFGGPDPFCPTSTEASLIQDAISVICSALPSSTAGPTGLGDRGVVKSPSITRVELDLSPAEMSDTFSLPLEWQDAARSIPASILLVGPYSSTSTNLISTFYQPTALYTSTPMWTEPKSLPIQSLIDITMIELDAGFILLFYLNPSSAMIEYAISNPGDPSNFQPLGLVGQGFKTVRPVTATFVANYVYVAFQVGSSTDMFMIKGFVQPAVVPIAWSPFARVEAGGAMLKTKLGPSVELFQEDKITLILSYVDPSNALRWATYDTTSSWGSAWIDRGTILQQMSDGPPTQSWYPLLDQGNGCVLLSFVTGHDVNAVQLCDKNNDWTYLNGNSNPKMLYNVVKPGLTSVALHYTPDPVQGQHQGNLYLSYVGLNGWEFTNLVPGPVFLFQWPSISTGACDDYAAFCTALPVIVKTNFILSSAAQWPAGTPCPQGFQPPPPAWALPIV